MSEPSRPFLPPELSLDDDDIVEQVEVVVDESGDPEHLGGPDHPDEEAPVPDPEPPRVSGFDGIGTRRESRERALALLYEAEQKQLDNPADILDQLPLPPETFAGELVIGVSDHLGAVDALIEAYSQAWPLERMPALDRALLRMGVYELTETDVPTGACISEAIELAKRYSTDDSHKFVNGMLARVAREHRPEP
jgi:N utilization substance protein B